jgi:hypothetical protein
VLDVFQGAMRCDQLSALFQDLAGPDPSCSLYGAGPALTVFATAGRTVVEIGLGTADEAEQLILKNRGTCLLTGTGDIDDFATRLLWIAARRCKVPSVAALDSADNLDIRFDVARGVAPDHVVAPNASAAARLAGLGFSAAQILLVDNLHHARLAHGGMTGRDALRNVWGVGPGTAVVLFASENAAEAEAMGRTVDFDEFALLDRLVSEFASGGLADRISSAGREVVIVVRPHPRDRAGKYDGYQRQEGPRIIVSAAGTPIEAASGADLVAGMRSALLDEAAIIGRAVYRLI